MKRTLSSAKVTGEWSGTPVKQFKRARLSIRSIVRESSQVVQTKNSASRSKGTSKGIEQARLIDQLRKENLEKSQRLLIERYEADKKLQAEILLRTQVEKRLLKEKLKRCEVEKKYLLERQRRMELDNRRNEFRRTHAPRSTSVARLKTRQCYYTWNGLGGWQKSSTRKHKFTWLNDLGFIPPEAIVKYILKFLNDDDLFRLRGTSLMFYEAFYSQEVSTVEGSLETSCPFNATRAIKLAWKGRVFTRLQALHTKFYEYRSADVFTSLSSDDLSVINPRFFPKLRSLRLGQTRDGVSLRGLPPHPRLISLTGPSYEEDDYMYITDEKFPKLRSLDLFYNFMAKFTRLSNLEVLGVDCEEIAWEEINHSNFPKLRLLRVRRNEIPKAVRTRLELRGVECIIEETESDDDEYDDGSLEEDSDSEESYDDVDEDNDTMIINLTDSASED